MTWNNQNTDRFGWNESKAQHLRTRLEEDGCEMTLAVLDYVSSYPGQPIDAQDILDATGLKSVRSLGQYLSHLTRIGTEMGIDRTQDHSWFISWSKPTTTRPWCYWLTRDRATWWSSHHTGGAR